MDNPEYTFQILEVFSKIKTKEIPRELEEYISYVARTGDPVFQWSLVKVLIKEKLLAVLNEFTMSNPSQEIPPCPNVDQFNYETMKSNLLSRLDSFILPPFTIQRICELLSAPRKEYNRIDKYMRAVEKNVLVVSACDLSLKRGLETDANESMINGMLYDKPNDSLNNFTNHDFSASHDSNADELHLSGKLDVRGSDAVQQILDESWNEGGDEFKINETNNSSSLSVSFDTNLQFVTDKDTCSDNDKLGQDKSIDPNTTLLIEPSLQNMISDNVEMNYEGDAEKDESLSKNEESGMFSFNDESLDHINVAETENEDDALSAEKSNTESTQSCDSVASSTSESDEFKLSEDEKDASLNDDVEEDDEDDDEEDEEEEEEDDDDKQMDVEEPFKNNTFEYEDFNEISTDNSEFSFENQISKEELQSSSTEIAESSTEPNLNENKDEEKEQVAVETESNSPLANEQPDSSTNDEKDDVKEQSFSCGDKELTRNNSSNECPKQTEPLPGVHGEPELPSINEEPAQTSSNEKFEHCLSSKPDGQ